MALNSESTQAKLKFVALGKTDVGRVRENNEDSLLTLEEEGLFVVCDGLGGHAAGEVASTLTTEVLQERLHYGETEPEEALRQAIVEANRRIREDQRRHPERSGMGTTVSALWIPNGDSSQAFIAHVGDSRIYCLREGEMYQLTEDHSPLFHLYRRGELTKDDLRHHPQKNLILRSLGQAPGVEVDITAVELKAGDICLLCTDGLTDHVAEDAIQQVLGSSDWEELPTRLVDLANDSGGYDNITVVLVRIV